MTQAPVHPANWKKVHVVDVCETVSVGIVIQPSQYYVDAGEGIRAFRSANVGENRIVDRDWVYLSPEGHRANSKSSLQAGDVLVVRSGAPGTACVVTEQYAGTNCIDVVFARPRQDQVLSEYLAEFTNSPVGRRHVLGMQGGLALKHFNVGAYKKLALLLPAVTEQKRIVDVLAAWDTAIQKTEQLIAAKERHFAATSHLLLTSRKRLNSFSGRWGFRRADEIFANTSRKGHINEPLLSVTQERGVIPRDMLDGRVTMPSGETGAFKLVEPGNFVISLRSFQGGLEHSNYCGLVSPAYTVLKEMVEIDERFFRHYFKSADFIKRLSVAVIGIRDGKQISFQDFCSIKLPFPAVDEQKAIAAFLDDAEGEITLLSKYTVALKTQKRGLMQKLL
ncbi:MAG: restriction endonuclease subunit S, partial [Chromatiales bacterium]|nr:restriction endonuclease subunit S [Chromatiales bacterium]